MKRIHIILLSLLAVILIGYGVMQIPLPEKGLREVTASPDPETPVYIRISKGTTVKNAEGYWTRCLGRYWLIGPLDREVDEAVYDNEALRNNFTTAASDYFIFSFKNGRCSTGIRLSGKFVTDIDGENIDQVVVYCDDYLTITGEEATFSVQIPVENPNYAFICISGTGGGTVNIWQDDTDTYLEGAVGTCELRVKKYTDLGYEAHDMGTFEANGERVKLSWDDKAEKLAVK